MELSNQAVEWVIMQDDVNFLVGTMNYKTNIFDQICICKSYDQAELILEALSHFIYAKNYSSKGVEPCQEVTAKFLKPTAKTGLPG